MHAHRHTYIHTDIKMYIHACTIYMCIHVHVSLSCTAHRAQGHDARPTCVRQHLPGKHEEGHQQRVAPRARERPCGCVCHGLVCTNSRKKTSTNSISGRARGATGTMQWYALEKLRKLKKSERALRAEWFTGARRMRSRLRAHSRIGVACV